MSTDIGPAPTPPAWCLPDAEPSLEQLTERHGGGWVTSWSRAFPDTSDADVWIECEDRETGGRIVRSQPCIHLVEPSSGGLTPSTARRLAAELLNAADVLDGE